MSMNLWRMLAAASVCLLVASLGAAIDMYDEIPPDDINLMYQEHNYLDPGSQLLLSDEKLDNLMRGFLLYKTLSPFRTQDASPIVLGGPKWIPPGAVLVPEVTPEAFDHSLMRGPMMKRFPDRKSNIAKGKVPAKPPVQKWKIKSGKSGARMLCYFKICAFQPAS